MQSCTRYRPARRIKLLHLLINSFMRISNISHRAWACLTLLVSVQCAALNFMVLIVLLYLISQTVFWHFGCFSFRLRNRPWCVHIHAIDPSVAMHRVVRILLFVLCLVPVSLQLASIWPLAEHCSQLKAIHSMRRGAGRGKPDGPKRLPIALGF